MSNSTTPCTPDAAGSTSRGTAMSMSTMGRVGRSSSATVTCSAEMTGCGASVEHTTTSALPSSSPRQSKPRPMPPRRSAISRAVPTVRLMTTSSPRPRSIRALAVDSAMRPPPTTRPRRPPRSGMASRARSAATVDTDTGRTATRVSVRTRLPVSSACRNSRSLMTPVQSSSAQRSQACRTWPWISLSPTTIESRLDVTRSRWATARSSRCA